MADDEPAGELAVMTVAMPKDTNPAGDIFGGWLMAQMDLAAGVLGMARAQGRVATVAVDGMSFHQPVLVGDTVGCWGRLVHVGRTSLQVRIETWVRRGRPRAPLKVTEGVFTLVALDDAGHPRPVPAEPPPAGAPPPQSP
ncbi:MAG: acyl-CoA thioesterase [Alphaproteobacteria bacterium]|jgi:acyl-CoA thioesterase YciA|nr:acyl-CoA thioesterase [Alphaproteobacteria bacterium]